MSDEQRAAPRAAIWAKSVSELTVSVVPEGAPNLMGAPGRAVKRAFKRNRAVA